MWNSLCCKTQIVQRIKKKINPKDSCFFGAPTYEYLNFLLIKLHELVNVENESLYACLSVLANLYGNSKYNIHMKHIYLLGLRTSLYIVEVYLM